MESSKIIQKEQRLAPAATKKVAILEILHVMDWMPTISLAERFGLTMESEREGLFPMVVVNSRSQEGKRTIGKIL